MPKLAKRGRILYSYAKESLVTIVKTKAAFIKKLTLLLAATTALLAIAAAPVFAEDPPLNTQQVQQSVRNDVIWLYGDQ
jgi:hypothetical protein